MEREPVVGLEQVARDDPLVLVAEVDQVGAGMPILRKRDVDERAALFHSRCSGLLLGT